MPRLEEPRVDDQHLPRGGGPNGTARIEVEESAVQDIPDDPDDPEELPDDLEPPEDDYQRKVMQEPY